MSRSSSCVMVGVATLVLGFAGSVLTSQAASASVGSLHKATACPPGYTLDPQNSQQCIPFGSGPGGPSGPPTGT
jgi:hypothetical protein